MRTSTNAPRIVIATRETDYELLLARHATRAQAAFFLQTRGLAIDVVEARHHAFHACLNAARVAIPVSWRRAFVLRHDFERFLFEPEDTVIAVGQDGLVANVAKYLSGQRVIGINPSPTENPGVLVPHPVEALGELLEPTVHGEVTCESRTMVEARLGDGQRIVALNEIYIGCRTHQSSRYKIRYGDNEERHSSSGVIVATGTGSTGWAKSIHRHRETPVTLPEPIEPRLAFFVREAWPSLATGAELTDGEVPAGERLELRSEMNEGGVLFGDGIESDALAFNWGESATVTVAPERLELVLRL